MSRSAESPSLKRDVGKADPNLSGAVDRIALRRAIEELPEGCRQIFDLHEVQGFHTLLSFSASNLTLITKHTPLNLRFFFMPSVPEGLAKSLHKLQTLSLYAQLSLDHRNALLRISLLELSLTGTPKFNSELLNTLYLSLRHILTPTLLIQ